MSAKINALVQSGDDRKPVWVFATDCFADKHGDIRDGSTTLETVATNALLDGNTPKDKFFTQICYQGEPALREMMDRRKQ